MVSACACRRLLRPFTPSVCIVPPCARRRDSSYYLPMTQMDEVCTKDPGWRVGEEVMAASTRLADRSAVMIASHA